MNIFKVKLSLIGKLTLLTLLFVILKLCKVIGWSWWWVLCPVWITFALCAAIIVTIAVAAVMLAIVEKALGGNR